jgi:hypothetical protein
MADRTGAFQARDSSIISWSPKEEELEATIQPGSVMAAEGTAHLIPFRLQERADLIQGQAVREISLSVLEHRFVMPVIGWPVTASMVENTRLGKFFPSPHPKDSPAD